MNVSKDTLIGCNTQAILKNKHLNCSTVYFTDNDKKFHIDLSNSKSNTTTTLRCNQSNNIIIDIPSDSDTLIGCNSKSTIENKLFKNIYFLDEDGYA